jgi:Zn-dependent protease
MEPAETPFDLRWRMFNIPVRVHPMFWVISAALGWWSYTRFGITALLVWMFAMFASILIHELGHVFMGRVFGTDGHIVLHAFGGLAIGSNNLSNPWKRIAVSFAGPGAQLVLLAAVWVVAPVLPQQQAVGWLVGDLVLINLFWPLLNLLPIWPLDGGQIARDLCRIFLGAKGVIVSLGISIAVAGLLAVVKSGLLPWHLREPMIDGLHPYLLFLLAFLTGSDMIMALWFAMFAANNVQEYQVEMQRTRWRDEEFPWAR